MSNSTPRVALLIIQVPGWLLAIYLCVAQGLSAFSYDLGVAMGTQEAATQITDVGAAFWYGFAFGDLVAYIPMLVAGLVGHIRRTQWCSILLAASLGITIYWPVVCLAAMLRARSAQGWQIVSELPYWVVCSSICIWGTVALFLLLRPSRESQKGNAIASLQV